MGQSHPGTPNNKTIISLSSFFFTLKLRFFETDGNKVAFLLFFSSYDVIPTEKVYASVNSMHHDSSWSHAWFSWAICTKKGIESSSALGFVKSCSMIV